MPETAERLSTYAEYLALEQATGVKHEYYEGHVLAMAGASPEHVEIVGNLLVLLKAGLRGRPCKAYASDLKIAVSEDGLYTYPDLAVVCGPLQRSRRDPNAVLNPSLLIEVLSDSTEAYDRGEKFHHYQRIPSLREVLLVSQRQVGVDHLRRAPDGAWVLRSLRAGDALRLESLDLELSVDGIYEDVALRARTPG